MQYLAQLSHARLQLAILVFKSLLGLFLHLNFLLETRVQSHSLAIEILIRLLQDLESRLLPSFQSRKFKVFEKLVVKGVCFVLTAKRVDFVVKCLNLKQLLHNRGIWVLFKLANCLLDQFKLLIIDVCLLLGFLLVLVEIYGLASSSVRLDDFQHSLLALLFFL